MGTPATLVSAWGCIPLPHWRVWPPVHNPLQGCVVPSKYTHTDRVEIRLAPSWRYCSSLRCASVNVSVMPFSASQPE